MLLVPLVMSGHEGAGVYEEAQKRECSYPYTVSSTSLDAFSVPLPQSRAFTWKMGSLGFIPDSSRLQRRAASRNASFMVKPFFRAVAARVEYSAGSSSVWATLRSMFLAFNRACNLHVRLPKR